MWRVKGLADPDGVLAPGVLLNRDPGVHLRNLKSTPPIEEVADHLRRVRLLRAGLPEPRPDDDAAPADRASAARSPASRRDRRSPRALLEQYEYDGIETCAADGSCMLACPLAIDTGKLVKGFRARGSIRQGRARGAARGEAVRRRSSAAARAGVRTGDAAALTLGDAPLRGADADAAADGQRRS